MPIVFNPSCSARFDGGAVDIHSALPNIPLVPPGLKYLGPKNDLESQIQTEKLEFDENTGEVKRDSIFINPGHHPTSDLDNIALRHDSEYFKAEKTDNPLKFKHLADLRMLREIKKLKTPINSAWNIYQKVLEKITQGIIGAKYKFGFGVKMSDILNHLRNSRKRTEKTLRKELIGQGLIIQH